MYEKLARQAIAAAITNDWTKALKLNVEILEENPEDVSALNRMSRAYIELGNIEKAQHYSEEVLKIDPLNKIAEKTCLRCTLLETTNGSSPASSRSQRTSLDELFLEDPGRTKIVNLINLCDKPILALLNTGDTVQMVPRQHRVSVTTANELYVGRLPDDIASRIIYLVSSGYQYMSYIKSVSAEEISIFIREHIASKSSLNTISFPFRK